MKNRIKGLGYWLVGIAVCVVLITTVYYEMVPREITVTIQEKRWSMFDASPGTTLLAPRGAAHNWIKETDGNWYENNVNYSRLKWNAIEIDKALEEGHTYRIKVRGLNLAIFRQFPLIVEVIEEVE